MNTRNEQLLPMYQFAVEKAEIGIHAVDQTGRTVIYNEKMKEIEGLGLEDVSDHSILELFNFDQQESTLLRVLETGQSALHVKQTYWNANGIEITTMNDTHPVYQDGKLIGAVEFARDITALEQFIALPFRKLESPVTFGQVTAVSEAMKSVISTSKMAASARLPVLLVGEAGTGKELIAECIHHAVSPEEQVFYTLYGRHADRPLLERADEIISENEPLTLFCERIDLLPIPLQRTLLEILQKANPASSQLIASMDEDPVDLIASGSLLKELYYFFSSFTIRIPPLRKRKEDLLPFITAYLEKRGEMLGSSLIGPDAQVKDLLLSYDWPGNFREVELLLNEVTTMWTAERYITLEMLPPHFRMKVNNGSSSKQPADFIVQKEQPLIPLDQYLREAEAYYLEKAMKLHNGNVTKTAEALGMSRQNLQYRLRKLK